MLRIVIVGAGPAGCIAAILLGGRGFDVTLIEQHRFPRDKVCGECLGDLAITVLRDLHLAEPLHKGACPIQLCRCLFFARCGRMLPVEPPRPMWGISRASLDSFLLSKAGEFARVVQPARCERLEGEAVVVRDLLLNRVYHLECDQVLLADGKTSPIDSRPAAVDLGIKSHWHDIDAPPDAIELFGCNGLYGGIAPVENGLFNASFSVPAARVNACHGDLDRLFCQIIGENRALSRQMSNARRAGPWRAAPLARAAVARKWPSGVIPIGNAAAALEPIGGEGMGLAMRSAQIAARELVTARDQSRAPDIAAVRRQFARLWRVRSMACRLAAQLISRDRLAAPMIDLLQSAPSVTGAALRMVGK